MLAKQLSSAASAVPNPFVEDVFSTYLYTGTGALRSVDNNIALGNAYGGRSYFPGSSNYLQVADNAAFEFGSGDFTVEGWINLAGYSPSWGGAYYASIFSKDSSAANGRAFDFRVTGTATSWTGFQAVLFTNDTTFLGTSANGLTINLGTWYHVAFVRSGTTLTIYLNGQNVGSGTNATSIPDRTTAVRVGATSYTSFEAWFNGNISNLRVVKGRAVYTSNFTPPSVPLGTTTGGQNPPTGTQTSLLTCQYPSPTVDNSSNAFTVTNSGATGIAAGGPFTDSSAGKGGLVWIKSRSAATSNFLFDTERTAGFELNTDTTDASTNLAGSLGNFFATGFTVGGAASSVNTLNDTYVSWTFRRQAKFFDVVTYTGNGANRTIAHKLGSVPGCIIIKRTDTTSDWQVYHRSLANTEYLVLNTTAAKATGATRWNSTTPTSAVFSLGTDASVNANGGTYVAYVFAHDAGGFGATGSDNVISCGSITTDASGNASVSLGYEPQFVMTKRVDSTSNWAMAGTTRGWISADTANANVLYANSAVAEAANVTYAKPTPTGFQFTAFGASATYVYVAIRRGPMRTPTSGTSVFGVTARSGTGANATVTGNSQINDTLIVKNRGAVAIPMWTSRLEGTGYLDASSTAVETAAGATILQANPWDVMTGVKLGTTSTITNASSNTFINYLLTRAPGFYEVVCYTGNGVAGTAITHGLKAKPQINFVKKRNAATGWIVYTDLIDGSLDYLALNSTAAKNDSSENPPTSSVFYLSSGTNVNNSGDTYIAHMFGNIAGVSKAGVYTGTGAAQTINCGFTNGARFVLIKRTDSTGDWYVWDTARGIIAGNDPYFLMNSTAAEVANTDYLSVQSSGFGLTATAPAALNANGGTYLYLALA